MQFIEVSSNYDCTSLGKFSEAVSGITSSSQDVTSDGLDDIGEMLVLLYNPRLKKTISYLSYLLFTNCEENYVPQREVFVDVK